MWVIMCILISVFSLGLVIPTQVLGSWCQPDKATSNVELIRITNDGSMAFLQGAIIVQQAMRMLDEGKMKDAKDAGVKAVDDFKMASGKFAEATNRVKQSAELQKELNSFLRSVSYEEKATQLRIAEPVKSLWLTITDLARKQGAIGLFNEAANRAKSKEELTRSFFNAITPERYNAIEGAKLLFRIGEDLVFGAYVSAIFAR